MYITTKQKKKFKAILQDICKIILIALLLFIIYKGFEIFSSLYTICECMEEKQTTNKKPIIKTENQAEWEKTALRMLRKFSIKTAVPTLPEIINTEQIIKNQSISSIISEASLNDNTSTLEDNQINTPLGDNQINNSTETVTKENVCLKKLKFTPRKRLNACTDWSDFESPKKPKV